MLSVLTPTVSVSSAAASSSVTGAAGTLGTRRQKMQRREPRQVERRQQRQAEDAQVEDEVACTVADRRPRVAAEEAQAWRQVVAVRPKEPDVAGFLFLDATAPRRDVRVRRLPAAIRRCSHHLTPSIGSRCDGRRRAHCSACRTPRPKVALRMPPPDNASPTSGSSGCFADATTLRVPSHRWPGRPGRTRPDGSVACVAVVIEARFRGGCRRVECRIVRWCWQGVKRIA